MIKSLKNLFTTLKNIPKSINCTIDGFNSIHLQVKESIQQKELKPVIVQAIETSKKAVWIHITNQNLKHVDYLCNQLGFKIHHGLNTKIVLYKWVSPLSDLVGPYSMFIVSCGAIVINDDKLLLVEQKSGPRKGLFGIPGGRADFGELLYQCAQRELLQQTGIAAKYKYVAYFRQLDKTYFGASDYYFACVMHTDKQSISRLKMCQRQIQSYQWVHLEEVGDWMKTRAYGTQKFLADYLQKLYRKGYRIQRQDKLVQENKINYEFPRDNIDRRIVEHMLINTKNDKDF